MTPGPHFLTPSHLSAQSDQPNQQRNAKETKIKLEISKTFAVGTGLHFLAKTKFGIVYKN